MTFFSSSSSVPPTPSEPDPEPEHTDIKPKLIPLMEVCFFFYTKHIVTNTYSVVWKQDIVNVW